MYKSSKRKLLLTVMLMLAIFFTLTACGSNQSQEPQPPSNADNNTSTEEPEDGTGVDVKEQQRLTLTFYYVDEELLSMKEKEMTISYFDEEEKWTALWQGLQNPGEAGYVSLWENVELLGVEIEGKQININLNKPDNLQFGSTAEGFAIQTLLQTVGQVEGIELVQLLVNGEVQETLAGHVSIDQPIPTDEIIYTGQ